MNWFRRIRGIVGMGLVWAVAWGIVGGVIEGILNFLPGSDLLFGIDMLPPALGMVGFLAGAVFSLVLWAAEGRRKFDELSPGRFSFWGAAGGVLLGGVLGAALVVLPIIVALSAGSAFGTLALARRAQ